MKFIKKFADWQTWVFIILPILLCIAWAAILIYAAKNSINNPTFLIFGQLLFAIAVVLPSLGIFTQYKRLTILGRIASVAFTACFIALQVASIALIPNLCTLNDKVNNLHDTLFEMTRDDPEYEQTHKAWREAAFDQYDLSFKVKMINGASCAALALSALCVRFTKKDNPELSEQSDNHSNDSEQQNSENGEQQA